MCRCCIRDEFFKGAKAMSKPYAEKEAEYDLLTTPWIVTHPKPEKKDDKPAPAG